MSEQPVTDVQVIEQGPGKSSKKSPWIIVLAVVGALLLCCCGATVGLISVGIIAEPETVIEEIGRGALGEPEPEPGGDDIISSPGFSEEVQRVTDRFYPGYTVDYLANVAGSDDENARVHVVAISPEATGFRILFEASRAGGDNSAFSTLSNQFMDPVSGALWTHDTGDVGLQGWAGPGSIAPRAEIPGPFVEAHPVGDLLVTDYEMISNVQVRLLGIREVELDGWDGSSTTWDSVWDLDIANSRWDEVSFSE